MTLFLQYHRLLKLRRMKKIKNKDICWQLFQKYYEIRGDHEFSDIIENDLNVVASFKFILNELIGVCDIHPNNLFRLLYVFKKDQRYTFGDIIKKPHQYVQIPLKIISFDQADKISRSYKLIVSNKERVTAWMYDQLVSQCNSIYADKMKIFRLYLKSFPNLDDLKEIVMEITFGNRTYITLPELYQLEVNIGDILMEHYIQCEFESSNTETFLFKYQSDFNIALTKQQMRAVKHALEQKLTVICGLPSTGKSTIAHAICEFHKNDFVYLLAPTGMAVNNLQNKCNIASNKKHTSGTIHKMIYDVFDKNMEHPPQVIIIDEFSMVDMIMFHEMCAWCVVFDCKLVIMADHQQLPPIGIGNPLSGLMNTALIKVFRLTSIKRQSNGFLKEMIKRLSKNVPVSVSNFDHKSVYFNPYSESNICNLIHTFGLTTSNTQFVSPQNKYSTGTVEMSRLLQNIFLPSDNRTLIHPSYSWKHTQFYENDFVVRTVNDYTEKCLYANGDVGTLTIGENKELVVNYQSGIKQTVNYEQLHDEFQLAYCMTVHKVQGSQYENVVIIIHPEHEFSWTNNESKQLLYTAVSRAKKRCFILGSKTLFMKAQHENHTPTSTDNSVMMKQFTNYTVS